MDLRRVRHFAALAETLNFSRAAERLHIAQPALSVSIRKLESELGTRLFERTSSGVVLTASGEATLLEAHRLLHRGDEFVRAARDAAQGTSGQLRIGFVGSAIDRVIPALIPSFRRQYPRVQLVLAQSTSAQIMAMLFEDGLDIGIVRTPLRHAYGAALHFVQRDRFVVALPAAHPFASASRIRLMDLAAEPFVMYSRAQSSGLYAYAMGACAAAGFTPNVTQEANQITAVLALVESGLGLALVPEVVRGQRAPHVVYLDCDLVPHGVETALAVAILPSSASAAAHRFVELSKTVGA